MAGQGFASMSKARQKEVARKGGKNSNKTGGKHQWSKAEAKVRSQQGVAKRMKNQADAALKRLVRYGFDPVEVVALGLSDAELVYYGGRMSEMLTKRHDELRERIATKS
jgi:hypothetical protein